MIDYSTLFRINEYATSAPFRLSNLLLPSVIHILIEDIVVLFTGLKVILCGFSVNEYDGCNMLVLKL